MKWFLVILFYGSTGALMYWGFPEYIKVPPMWNKIAIEAHVGEYKDYFIYAGFGLGTFCLFFMKGFGGFKSQIVCRLKGFQWDLNDFCRGWLITGKTGSGKTASAIAHIIHQLFKNVNEEKKIKPWGGVAVDQKGNFFKIIEDIAENYGQSDRLITLKVRSPEDPADWKPKYTYNLLSYPGIPASTYAKMIIDTASSLGQESGGGGGFFKTQAQLHIEQAIDLLKIINFIKNSPDSIRLESNLSTAKTDDGYKSDLEIYNEMPSFVSLKNIYELLTDKELLKLATGILQLALDLNIFAEQYPKEHKQIELLTTHFTQKFLNQPVDQLGGVIGTINNYLGFFTSDEICEVFCCEENTVEFEEVDNGVIFSVSMPQRFQSERVYVNTLMKMIYYTHALSRFDRPDDLKSNNLLIFIADEAQGVITASKDGMTDYTVIDKIREARATVLFAAQSTTSFLPVMKKEQVDTLLLNLANQVHYTVADENNSKLIADQIGKKEKTKKSHGFSGGKRSVNYQKQDEHIIKPHILRGMKKFECVLIHCERGFRKLTLKPITPEGKVPDYYSKIKR
jgi:hypothetical protein